MFFHQGKIVSFQRQVAILIAKVIGGPGFGGIGAGVIGEVKALGQKLGLGRFRLALRVELLQYSSVLSEYVMHITHIVVRVAVQPVVVAVSALV